MAAGHHAVRRHGLAVDPTPEHRSPTSGPDETAGLTEVVAVSGDNVWAFGDHDDNAAATNATNRHTIIVLRWDGSTWRQALSAPRYTVDIRPFPNLAAAGDGAGGFLLASYQHGTADGTLRVVGYPEPPPSTAQGPSLTGQFKVNDLHLAPRHPRRLGRRVHGSRAVGRLPSEPHRHLHTDRLRPAGAGQQDRTNRPRPPLA